MRSKLFSITLVSLLFLLLSGCQCVHDWTDATCTAPKMCTKCEITEGEALGHDWIPATCEEAETCSRCAETRGAAISHTWNEATCSSPKTCQICKATEGTPLAHHWKSATCTAPKTCTRCSLTEGEALGHTFPSDQFGQSYYGWTVNPDDISMQIIRCCSRCSEITEKRQATTDLTETTNSAVSNNVFNFTVGELTKIMGELDYDKPNAGYDYIVAATEENSPLFLYPISLNDRLSFDSDEAYVNQGPFIYFVDQNNNPLTVPDGTFNRIGIGCRNYNTYPRLCNTLMLDLIQACAPHFDETTSFIVLNTMIYDLMLKNESQFEFGSIGTSAVLVDDTIVFNIYIP